MRRLLFALLLAVSGAAGAGPFSIAVPAGGGGGSGTVSPGTAGQAATYSSNGNTVVGTNPTYPNVVDPTNTPFGADRTGATDSTAAINSAASTQIGGAYPTVQLPTGTFSISNSITLQGGQCLQGAGDHSTFLHISSNFSASATGVIVMTGNETSSPCLHDIGFIFDQPPGLTGATTAAQASGTTITVNFAVPVGYIINDATTGTAVPFQTVVTAVSGTNPYTLTLSSTVTGVLSGDTINANPARANATALSTPCNVGSGGQICQYPPVVYDVAANRPLIYNLYYAGAWGGLDFTGGGVQNIVPWVEKIWSGALSYNIRMDGGQDFSHINGFHVYQFGWAGNDSANAWHDGSTYCAQVGREDTANWEDITCFDSVFNITANANNSEGASKYVNISLDGNPSQLVVAGGFDNQFVNLNKSGSGNTCPLNITAGLTEIMQPNWQPSGTSAYVCVPGGTLKIFGGTLAPANGGINSFLVNGGFLDLEAVALNLPSTITAPAISQTSGSLIVRNLTCHPGTSGTFLGIASDNNGNAISGIVCPGYGTSPPTGSLTGSYQTPDSSRPVGNSAAAIPTYPTLYLEQLAGATNNKIWQFNVGGNGTVLHCALTSDAWASGTDWCTITRSALGLIDIGVGNTTDNPTIHFNTSNTISYGGPISESKDIQSTGTKFTATGCSNSATVGGATAGQYTSGTGGACTVVITLPTTTNAYACSASDTTTPADMQVMSASTTTSATITGTTVSGDVIKFSCTAGAY